MTRKEVEEQIIERLKEIKGLLDEFYSDKEIVSDYLTLLIKGTHLSVNNDYFDMVGTDYSSAIDCWLDVDDDGNWEEIYSRKHPDFDDFDEVGRS